MKTHHLKTWPSFFQDVRDGKKRFEVRKNDRGFSSGDHLVLHEFTPDETKPVADCYTGRAVTAQVGFVLYGGESGQFGVQPGYCVMSLQNVSST